MSNMTIEQFEQALAAMNPIEERMAQRMNQPFNQETQTMTKYIVTDHNGQQVASFIMRTLDIAALDELDEEEAEAEMDKYQAETAQLFLQACAAQGVDPIGCSAYAL